MELLKVGSASKAHAVSTAIAEYIRRDGAVEVVAIGVPAVHEATKAIIYAKGHLSAYGLALYCIPRFDDVEVPPREVGETASIKTAIKWIVKTTAEPVIDNIT